MADNTAVITSANLTDTAFSRRFEVGIILGYDETVQLAALYDRWWQRASEFDVYALRPIPSTHGRRHGDDPGRALLRKLWSLPDDPGGGDEHSGREFRDLEVFLDYYREFASAYEATQRLWPDVPLWFETDTFLNYLRHECSGKPSHKYLRNPAREFGSEQEKRGAIATFARKFATDPDPERGQVEKWAREKVDHSKLVQEILSESRIDQITLEDVTKVVGGFNCFTSLPLNKKMFLNPQNNGLRTIREAWRELLYGTGAIVERMRRCHGRLVRLGPSGIQELMGFHQPEKYPLRNSQTDAGLRLLGYPI